MNEKLIYAFLESHQGKRAKTLLASEEQAIRHVFGMVYAQVSEVLPHLDEGFNYTIGAFFGDDPRWTGMSKGAHVAAGLCLSYMVRNEISPLYRHITPSGQGAAKYRNTPPTEPVLPPIVRVYRLVPQAA